MKPMISVTIPTRNYTEEELNKFLEDRGLRLWREKDRRHPYQIKPGDGLRTRCGMTAGVDFVKKSKDGYDILLIRSNLTMFEGTPIDDNFMKSQFDTLI